MRRLEVSPVHGRGGASRMVVSAAIIVVLVVAGLGVLVASGALSSKSSSSPGSVGATISPSVSLSTSSAKSATSTSGSNTSSLPSLSIIDFYADVNGPDYNQLNDNDTTLPNSGSGGSIYLGNAGDTLTMDVTLIYTQCQEGCPTHVVNVTIQQSDFTVKSVSPVEPIGVDNPPGTPSSIEYFQFTVTVASSSTAYDGPLTVISTVQ